MSIPPCPWGPGRRVAKRALDVVAAAGALAVLGLPLLLLALAVRVTSPGPALFRQERVGRGGRRFRIWKLRTMIDGASARGPAVTSSGDPRVTPLGRLLRRSKLDELPQLVNVLLGDMSLVGPRPEVPRYVAAYRPEDLVVLSVRPGITDPASLVFRDEERVLARFADRERAYVEEILPRKLALARAWVREQSLAVDLGLILRTLVAVVRPGNTAGNTLDDAPPVTAGPHDTLADPCLAAPTSRPATAATATASSVSSATSSSPAIAPPPRSSRSSPPAAPPATTSSSPARR